MQKADRQAYRKIECFVTDDMMTYVKNIQGLEWVHAQSPGSTIHGIFQARILEWVSISSLRCSSWPRDWTYISHLARQILYQLYNCFPGGSVGKNSPANAGEVGLIPVSGRFPGKGNGNPLQYFGLKFPRQKSLVGYSPWTHKRIRHYLVTKQQHKRMDKNNKKNNNKKPSCN